jgi:hypothetical protein
MRWLKHLFGQTDAAELVVPAVRFLSEQDGEVEREMKKRWTSVLARNSAVDRAYLARVSYDGASSGVALCLKHIRENDAALVDALGDCFRQIFNSRERLDIIFIDRDQEARLSEVCRPFYLLPNTPLQPTSGGRVGVE